MRRKKNHTLKAETDEPTDWFHQTQQGAWVQERVEDRHLTEALELCKSMKQTCRLRKEATYNFLRELLSLPASGLNFEGVDATSLRFTDILLALGVGVAISAESSSLEISIAVVVNFFLPLFLGVEFRTELDSTGSVLTFFIKSISGERDLLATVLFLLTISTGRAKKNGVLTCLGQ